MGSVEEWSVGLEGGATLILACLALGVTRARIIRALGILWLALAAFDLSLLVRPDWTRWRDMGSYWFFISAMLWIGKEARRGNNTNEHIRPAPSRRRRTP